MENKKIIVAIDGFSSSGKSTVAKALARHLNYNYIDTGAMYRAVTLYVLRNNLLVDGIIRESDLDLHLDKIKIDFRFNPSLQKSETYLNEENVENTIRNLKVSNHVSQVSSIGSIREKLVKLQQEMGRDGGIVMDGRDIGTTVFPNADLKIYMTSSVEVRAERRYKELIEKGQAVALKEIEDNIRMRDHIDTTRDISPLRKAEDAIELDNSLLTQDEQFEWILEKVNQLVSQE